MAREIIYPTFVVVLIASVWALGWEKSHTDQLQEYRPHFSQYDEEPAELEAYEPPATSVTSAFYPGDDE